MTPSPVVPYGSTVLDTSWLFCPHGCIHSAVKIDFRVILSHLLSLFCLDMTHLRLLVHIE